MPDLRNVDRQILFCTFCARAQNAFGHPWHLGPLGPSGKGREKIISEVKSHFRLGYRGWEPSPYESGWCTF